MNNNNFYSTILTILIILTICFIFSNSLESREVSSEKSNAVMEMVEPLFEGVVGEGNVTNHLIRKTAHFVEFFTLGVLLTARFVLAFFSEEQQRCSKWIAPITALGCGVLIAAMDETIQIFSHRGAQVQDVLLDSTGVAVAVCLVYGVWMLLQRKKVNL